MEQPTDELILTTATTDVQRRAIRQMIRAVSAIVAVLFVVVGCGGSAAIDPIAWERFDPDPASMGGPFVIIPWKDGFVGVGVHRDRSGNVWTSDDGRVWTPDEVPDVGWGGPVALVEVDGTLVAVGSVRVPGAQAAPTTAAVWTSRDGSDWERVVDPDLDPAPGFVSTQLLSVATGPHGLVAAAIEEGEFGGRVATWRSADGMDWVRSSAQFWGAVSSLLAVPDGYVLAVALPETVEAHAAFWFSEDGLEWTAALDQPSFRAATVRDLATNGDTIVAVGSRATPTGTEPMAWTSGDGRTWRPVPEAPPEAEWPSPDPWPGELAEGVSGSSMDSVHAWGSGFIAVGMQSRLRTLPDGSLANTDEGAFWRSSDGLTWVFPPEEQIPGSGAPGRRLWYRLWSADEIGGRIFVLGQTDDLGITHWLGPEPPE